LFCIFFFKYLSGTNKPPEDSHLQISDWRSTLEKNLKPRHFRYLMRAFQQLRIFGQILIILSTFYLLSGCASHAAHSKELKVPSLGAFNPSDLEKNPCGILHIQQPLFNVTGFLTADVKPNSSIALFVVPNSSFRSALYVVKYCAWLLKKTIDPGNQFHFDHLPASDYVAMVPRSVFWGKTQGFPIVRGFNHSNYSLRFNFYGGDRDYSLVSFSIHPARWEGKTEK